MDSTSLNISLPQALKEFVESKVASGDYSSASEYVRELIRAVRKKEAEDELVRLLDEGFRSGEPIDVTPEYWAEKGRRLREYLAKKAAA